MMSRQQKGITDAELIVVRDGFERRRDAVIQAAAGKPLERAPIEYDWNNRGNFTRAYAHSIVNFAMRSFYLNEQLSEANAALQELCQYYLDNPPDMYEIHSFHWSGALICRIYAFFNPNSAYFPGRLSPETQALMLETMWQWARKMSRVSDAEVERSQTWDIRNSENHHAMEVHTAWGFAKSLKYHASYAARAYDDGQTAQAHFDAWTAYLKVYLRERAKKGLLVETANKGYNTHTVEGWYNLYDFAEDATLRQRAGYLLDLYWITWAEEQLDGVRGGGQARIYQGARSQKGNGSGIPGLAWYYLNRGKKDAIRPSEWMVATSVYRMPLVVMDIALNPGGRGVYEVKQRRMGLVHKGYSRPPFYRLRTDVGGIYRYSYCTPDFIIGTLMFEARPCEDWAAISAQNRWHGVIFLGHPDARIYPQCEALDRHLNLNHHGVTLNQQWSVQRKGALIAQKLPGPNYSQKAGDMRVWFSEPGIFNRVEENGWVFAEAEGAYAAVRPVSGSSAWDAPVEGENGRWLRCARDLTPVIIEVARKVDCANYAAFRSAVASNVLRFEDDVLTYTGLGGDRFTFHADYSLPPEVNGEAVDYAPRMVFDSPFVRSEWDSGVVRIVKGERELVLDFNAEATD